MASRNFHRVQSLTRETKNVHAVVTIGASGAPTKVANDSVGVATVTRDTAGVYIVTLDDKYNSLVGFHVMQEATTAEDLTFQVESEDVAGAKTVQFQCKAAAVETDPSSGSTLRVTMVLKNTSVAR